MVWFGEVQHTPGEESVGFVGDPGGICGQRTGGSVRHCLRGPHEPTGPKIGSFRPYQRGTSCPLNTALCGPTAAKRPPAPPPNNSSTPNTRTATPYEPPARPRTQGPEQEGDVTHVPFKQPPRAHAVRPRRQKTLDRRRTQQESCRDRAASNNIPGASTGSAALGRLHHLLSFEKTDLVRHWILKLGLP